MLVQRIKALPRLVIYNESELQLNLHSSEVFMEIVKSEISHHDYAESKWEYL